MSRSSSYDLQVEWEKRDEGTEDLLESIPTDLFKRGKVLYQQGDESVEFCVIKVGKLEVAKHSPDGTKTILGIFGPGQPVGAMAVLKEIPYPATVRALEDTIVYRFRREVISRVKSEAPGWFSECLSETATRFASMADRFESVSTRNLESRLARQLLSLIDEYGVRQDDEVLIDTKITRQMLADMVGCRVESAIRRLSRWEKEGLIETDESRITLKDPYRIQAIAEQT